MSIWKTIFGGGDIIKSGVDLIDSLHTSDEEEIAAKSKAKVDLLSAYAPFKVAQRVLAFSFTFVYLFSFAMIMGGTIYHEGYDLTAIRGVISEFWIGEIMLTIVLFYFGGGAFEGGANALRSRINGTQSSKD